MYASGLRTVRAGFRAGEPRGGACQLPLAPTTFKTLVYLARSGARLGPKTELLENVWSGTFVTEDVLVHSVVEIRRATGDDARHPRQPPTGRGELAPRAPGHTLG